MKKLILILLAAVMLLSLCACGAEVPEDESDLQVTAKPKTETVDTTASEQTTEPEEETTADADKKELAKSCIEKDVAELYALIGQPDSSDYAPSCLVEGGEDGMLYYDGFVVYTTRNGDIETVYYVE